MMGRHQIRLSGSFLMERLILAVVCIACFAGIVKCQDKPNGIDHDDSLIVRISPSRFRDLPKTIVNYLVKNGYKIPQSYEKRTPHNVISGSFCKPGQRDWAVLASKNGQSSILVFWNGSPSHIDTVASANDGSYLQGMGSSGILYSRMIETNRIDNEDYARLSKESNTPPTKHDAIEDIFLDKASDILFFHNGKWITFPGSD